MTIGEVAKRAGLQASAIRYYEKMGLLAAPSRNSGRRTYQPEVVHQLFIICFAKEIGFTLDEIRLLLHDFPENTSASVRWSKLARAKIAQMEQMIVKARAVKKMLESVMECKCQKLEDCARGLATHSRVDSGPQTPFGKINAGGARNRYGAGGRRA
jgi:MerR family redox-sensitive transcriptional activator SoxR